jgi:hypothetical protein
MLSRAADLMLLLFRLHLGLSIAIERAGEASKPNHYSRGKQARY